MTFAEKRIVNYILDSLLCALFITFLIGAVVSCMEWAHGTFASNQGSSSNIDGLAHANVLSKGHPPESFGVNSKCNRKCRYDYGGNGRNGPIVKLDPFCKRIDPAHEGDPTSGIILIVGILGCLVGVIFLLRK